MDPRVGPVGFPAVQIRLRGLDRLEAQPFQRRLLRVADAGFDFPLPIRIAHATREGHHAVVREHVAVQRIEGRVVDVRRQHAFPEIVEDDDLHGAAQAPKRLLVERRPDRRARSPRQQSHTLAGVAQRQHEETHPPVLAGARIADHRPIAAVVDLAFLAGGGRDDDAGLDGRAPAQLDDEAPDTRVARREAVVVDQVLPDGHRVAAPADRLGDHLPIRLARARARRAGRRGHGGVGGHRRGNCRFRRTFARSSAATDGQARRAQVPAGRHAVDTGRVRDAGQRPAQAAERQDLLLLLVVQDVAHLGEGLQVHRPRQRLGRRQLIVGLEVSIKCRFWVSTEGPGPAC